MNDQFARTRILLGDDAIKKLQSSRVAVFGIGGRGGGKPDLAQGSAPDENALEKARAELESNLG